MKTVSIDFSSKVLLGQGKFLIQSPLSDLLEYTAVPDLTGGDDWISRDLLMKNIETKITYGFGGENLCISELSGCVNCEWQQSHNSTHN